MRDLTVQIAGTCCFVDRKNTDDPFIKRVVIPADTLFDTPEDQHIPYVEFPKNAIISGSNLSGEYTHGEGRVYYRRFQLNGHKITIGDIDPMGYTPFGSYTQHVPKMTVLAPTLDTHPRSECFSQWPDPALLAGFFDISHGLLKAGSLYEFVTGFRATPQAPLTSSVRTPEFVELLLPITSDILSVKFEKPGESPVEVLLNAEATVITIGNQVLDDIVGTDPGDDVKHHFLLYYELCDPVNKPSPPPLPEIVSAPLNSCTVTNWP